MGRPPKYTVDYFSHDSNASERKTLSVLFNTFGHEGISLWWQLLERISGAENHVIDLRNSDNLEFLAAKLRFDTDRMLEILNKLASLDAIDKQLWQHNIVWCQKLVDRLKDVYYKRSQDLPIKPSVSDSETPVSDSETEFPTPESTQTKLNYTILKDIILTYNIQGIPEDFHEIIDPELWAAFIEMRKKLKAVHSKKALTSLIKKLNDFREMGYDPNKIIEQSLVNSWKGIFEPKSGGLYGKGTGKSGGIPGNKSTGALADIKEQP